MKRLLNILQPIKVFFIRIVKRCFSNALNTLMSIAMLEIILQFSLNVVEDDYSLNNSWHVICWGIWFAILTLYKISRK